MPLVARGKTSGDKVTCTDHGDSGTNCGCCVTLETTTAAGALAHSMDVFIAGHPVVRFGDIMEAHPRNYGSPETLCDDHSPPCNKASPNVFANGKGMARLDDTFELVNGHVITTVAQQTVFANG